MNPLPTPPTPHGLYRAHDLLAASHLAAFPKICVNTNQPADHSIRYHFAWPWELVIWRGVFGLTLLFSVAGAIPAVIFGAIISGVVFAMKKMLGHTLYLPLSDEVWKREQRRVLLLLIADVFMFLQLPLMRFFPIAPVVMAILFTVISCLWNVFLSPLKMVRADARFVYLRGADPDFLSALPELSVPMLTHRRTHSDAGVWRWHEMMVVRAGTPLPDRCVLTNAPAKHWIRLRALWPNAIALALLLYSLVCLNFCGLFLILIVYISAKRVNLKFPLSEEAFKNRQRAILVYLTALICALVLVPPVAMIETGALFFFGFAWTLFAAVSWEAWVGLPIKIERVDGDYIFFTGVHHDYLATLPEY